MSQTPDHAARTGEAPCGDAQDAEALLAGTLALMTAYAKSCCDGCREIIAGKIISNLYEVSQHPAATAGFRAVALNLHGCWTRQLQTVRAEAHRQEAAPAATPFVEPPPRTLWHTTAGTIQ